MLKELVSRLEYLNIYGDSSIPESSFKMYSLRASRRVNYYTHNRITQDLLDTNEIGSDIKNATCEIINLLIKQEKLKENISNNGLDKASETVGPHSVSYVNKSNLQANEILSGNELEKECYSICYQYLVKYGLMNRSVY